MPKWLEVLKSVAPMVLAFTPLAPIVPAIVVGIAEAEKIPGASGAEKLAHVQKIARQAAEAANAQAGHEVINPDEMDQASAAAISTAVTIVNMTHKQAA